MAFWWVSGLLLSAILWKGRGVVDYLKLTLLVMVAWIVMLILLGGTLDLITMALEG